MNLLVDNLPEEIGGEPICTDYRRMIQLEQLIEDDEVTADEKLMLAIQLLYQRPVTDLQKAWDGLLWYYSCGSNDDGKVQKDSAENNETRGDGKRVKKAYDFEQDAAYIYAAFWQVYRIDLQQTPLHWWAFVSLLSALPDSCLMGKIMQYRTMDTSKLKGAQKKHIQALQRAFAIKQKGKQNRMTLEERTAATLARIRKRQKEAQEWALKNGK